MYTTPILVIIFNRPDFAYNLYLSLKQLQPSKLYVISDGARTVEELEPVKQSRNIFNNIDWDCQVKYNYSEINLGLRKRISSGITWAFQNEEQLIILEDDCIPHPDFFIFCEELLLKYKDDTRIMCINGCNLNPKISENFEDSYFFSRYSSSWGWATWKRAWDLYDGDLVGLDKVDIANNFHKNLPFRYRSKMYWTIMLFRVKNLKIDSWAYRWMFSLWVNNGLAIVPQTNLIQNIGNDKRSTNTKGNLHYINIRTSNMTKSNKFEPKLVAANSSYDNWLENTIYSKSLVNRIRWILNKILYLFVKKN